MKRFVILTASTVVASFAALLYRRELQWRTVDRARLLLDDLGVRAKLLDDFDRADRLIEIDDLREDLDRIVCLGTGLLQREAARELRRLCAVCPPGWRVNHELAAASSGAT